MDVTKLSTIARQSERRGPSKSKGRSRRTGRAFFGDEQAPDPEWRPGEDPVWLSKGKKGKKGLSTGNDGFHEGGFRPHQSDKGAVQARTCSKTKAEERTNKEEARKGTHPQSGFSATETLNEEGYGQAWESDDWSASHWTDGSCTRSTGSRTSIERFKSMHGIMALRRNSAFPISLSCLPTPKQKPAVKVAFSAFQQHHHVPPRLMCLRQVMCPSCFPSLR